MNNKIKVKKKKIKYTYDGRSQTLAEWAHELNIKYNTLYNRLYRKKWSIEKAFSTPSKKSGGE